MITYTACRLIPSRRNVTINQYLSLKFEVECNWNLESDNIFLYTAGELKDLHTMLPRAIININPLGCSDNKQNISIEIFLSMDTHNKLQGVVMATGRSRTLQNLTCISLPMRYKIQDGRESDSKFYY